MFKLPSFLLNEALNVCEKVLVLGFANAFAFGFALQEYTKGTSF